MSILRTHFRRCVHKTDNARAYADMRRDMHQPSSGFATHPREPVRNMNASQKASSTRISRQTCSVRRMHISDGHKMNLRMEAPILSLPLLRCLLAFNARYACSEFGLNSSPHLPISMTRHKCASLDNGLGQARSHIRLDHVSGSLTTWRCDSCVLRVRSIRYPG